MNHPEVVIDSLSDILDLAQEVVTEYAPDTTMTRIERLARWMIANVGDVDHGLARVTCADNDPFPEVHTRWGTFDPDFARQLAADLIRAADRAENGDD